ncbi:MAG TPA: hypothetical protein VHC46_03055 [Thermodesulfobacteriota bacterium]|nr:hypothetical protein [Thermodesulfobacteriota bacterium]
MRKAVTLCVPFVILFLFLIVTKDNAGAQTTDEEIKLIKEKIEQLNNRLQELEARKSEEEHEAGTKKSVSIPDPVTFLNSSGAGIKKTAEPDTPKTLLTGSGSLNLTGNDDPRRFNALFSPLFHRQLATDLHLVLKPEFKLEEDKIGVGLGIGEVDFFLNDFMTLRGGKLQSPFNVIPEKTYTSLPGETEYLPVLYPRTGSGSSNDILSDLRNVGVGVSGGIPLKFFGGASIDYGISFVNGESGPGVMNFILSISQK